MRQLIVISVFCSTFLAVAGPAAAATFDLAGDEIIVRRLAVGTFGNQSVPQNTVVSDAIEYQCTDRLGLNCPFGLKLDVGATTIDIIYEGARDAGFPSTTIFGTFSFNGYVFENLDPGMPIGGIELLNVGTSGTLPILSFTTNSVTLDLRDVLFTTGDSLRLILEPGATVVPLPATLPLAAGALALLGLFATGRRRSRRNDAGRQHRAPHIRPAAL